MAEFYDSDDDKNEEQLRLKLENLDNKKEEIKAEDVLRTKLHKEYENTKYWAPVLLLFPLAPVIVAISTVVIGGIVINVSPSDCNADLKKFMQGAVGLSYILLLFYSYCWIGPRPIKSLRTIKIFYIVYGVICFGWWGIYGTLETSRATRTGLKSCFDTATALYVASGYEVAMFWILFCVFMCFALKEIALVYYERDQIAKQKAKEKQLELDAKLNEEEKERERLEEEKRKKEEQEEIMRKEQEEREKLYASSSDEENNDKNEGEQEEEEEDDDDDEEDEEGEEDDEDEEDNDGEEDGNKSKEKNS